MWSCQNTIPLRSRLNREVISVYVDLAVTEGTFLNPPHGLGNFADDLDLVGTSTRNWP